MRAALPQRLRQTWGFRQLKRLLSTASRSPALTTATPTAAVPGQSSIDTFCIHPWINLKVVSVEGEARVCCRYAQGAAISQDGVAMSLHTHSLDAIWNSAEMRGIRRDMVEGKRVPGCAECYQEEKGGGFSMRMRDNAQWEAGVLNEERATMRSLKTMAAANDYAVPVMPANIEIDTGNLCNLKCRMCSDSVSSRIATDPVHRRWATDGQSHAAYHNPEVVARPFAVRRWLFDEDFVQNELLRHPGQVKRLYFIGGEPLLVKEVGHLLQGLINAGVARKIKLAVVTNGTVTGSWLEQAAQFKSIEIAISMDGFDHYYDYIRYPGRWSDVVRNIAVFKRLKNASLGGAVTMQNLNALNITELFRYLDSIDMGFFAYPLHFPRYLSFDALPPNARTLGAARLREYAEGDCRPQNREMVRGLASQLEPKRDRFDAQLLRDFMLFTNDLDTTRGQSFRDTHGELLALMSDAGFTWTSEKLHAGESELRLVAKSDRPYGLTPSSEEHVGGLAL
jgi:MoaA/NifB/PqqE/SkfB family radical SAM enzyme